MADPVSLGPKVRRLRRHHALTQVQLAGRLGISASYLALIENGQRPLTVPLLLKLGREFDLDLDDFTGEEDGRLVGELSEVFAESMFDEHSIQEEELRQLVVDAPQIARAVLDLHRAWRRTLENVDHLAVQVQAQEGAPGDAGTRSTRLANEEVSDLFQDHENHFDGLERAATELWGKGSLSATELYGGLARHLRVEHGVEVEVAPAAALGGAVRRYDPSSRRLVVSEVLPQASLVFQLAHQIGMLRADELFEPIVEGARLEDAAGPALARLSLASYFAGAVLMPYEPFLEAARDGRYDIELLEHRFRASFEQVCHRLSTLGRPGNSGVPLHFVRIDIAGNISKRFSRSGIRFARYSGSCPRWNVHSAFLTPGAIRRQVSAMPDGTRFFCVARTVRKAGGGHRIPQSRMAIGIGCELGHAREFVYSDGLDLDSEESIVPIGTACRLCDRMDCRQRAFPPMHQQLVVDENVRGLTIYANPKR